VTELEIRDMTPADIEPCVAMYQSGGWEERHDYLAWELANPATQMLVGVRDGSVVATAMATVNGPVGWVGSIFVDATMRSRGYGRVMTEAACALIDAAGCRTQALIASPLGKPLYDTMGFRVDALYQILEAEPLATAPTPPPGRILRPMTAADLDRVCALDRRATGEDRRALIASLVETGWAIEDAAEPDAGACATLVSILPDEGTLIAPEIDDAVCLLDQLRHLGRGRAKAVRAIVPLVHESGWRGLEERGWNPTFQTPRMLRGEGIAWDPTLIWSILSFGFG
jgi:GNAT superfamily N-acetyltransferase